METNNTVIQLCIQGTRAEFLKQPGQARELYQQAWEASLDSYEKCIAAHYLARFQPGAQEKLDWNLRALAHACEVKDGRIDEFLPSLYVNLGQSYENIGQPQKAEYYYGKAAELGLMHQPG